MSLLHELLDEEGGRNICELLLQAAEHVKSAVHPVRRTFDLNRFEVVIDGDKDKVDIFDVLQANVGEEIPLDLFAAAVRDRLDRLLSVS